MRFVSVGDEDTVMGFRLAGITGWVAETPEEARRGLDASLAEPDCGIIIITEKVATWISGEIEAIRSEREHPLIVEIPGPEGPLAGHKGLSDLMQEALGVRVE